MNNANEDRWYAFARRAAKMSTSELIEEAQALIAEYEAEHGSVPMAKRVGDRVGDRPDRAGNGRRIQADALPAPEVGERRTQARIRGESKGVALTARAS